jgi:DNA-binding MarR family transcriptional regulator
MRKTKSSRVDSAPPDSPPAEGPGELLGRELSTAVILFHEAIASRLGMSAAEWRCLGLLSQHGPATAGWLAERSGFTTGAITGIVDRLEKGGYVRREPNPKDRRSVIIRPLHKEGLQEVVTPIFASLGRAMAELSSRYSAKELAAIRDYFERTIQILRAETAKLSEAGGAAAASPRDSDRGARS